MTPAASGGAPAVEHPATPAPTPGSDKRLVEVHRRSFRVRGLLRWPTVTVLALGLIGSLVLATVVQKVVSNDEDQLLQSQTDEVGYVIGALLGQVQSTLTLTASAGAVSAGNPAAFAEVADKQLLSPTNDGGFFTGMALLRQDGGSGYRVVTTAGQPRFLGGTKGTLVGGDVAGFLRGQSLQLDGFAGAGLARTLRLTLTAPAAPTGWALYAEIPLPPGTSAGSDGPFGSIIYAVYLDGTEQSQGLVFGNTDSLPITGTRAAVFLDPNASQSNPNSTLGSTPGSLAPERGKLLIVVAATTPLIGHLASLLPWFLLGGMLLCSVLFAGVIEVVLRRRDQAVAYARGVRDAAAHRALLEAELRQAQRLEAVGQLAGGIAHDFNNLLAVILSSADFLRAEPGDPAAVENEAEEIIGAARRAADLTRQLLIFSRREVVRPVPLDISHVVTDCEKLLRRTLGEDIELHITCSPDLPPVLADEGEMQQVMMNLAVNARDAMQGRGGSLAIVVDTAEVDDAEAGRRLDVTPGQYVQVTVTDSGCGMEEDVAAHAFEPFFTTKGPGRGTGLGLSTVYGIVTRWHGNVEVESAPGRGTTFRILLPVTTGAASVVEGPPAPVEVRGHGETVLLVEDEAGVRRAARRTLERAGYGVVEAASGPSALDQFVDDGPAAHADVLVTDVVMPGGMSGRDLAERIHDRRPGFPVVYMSGYTADTIAVHGVLEEGIVLVEKPFTDMALIEAIRSVLAGSTEAS